MNGDVLFGLIILSTALFGVIQLLKSLRMVWVCATVYGVCKTLNYRHVRVDELTRRTKMRSRYVMAALIADKRFVRVVRDSWDVWTVEKQWRV